MTTYTKCRTAMKLQHNLIKVTLLTVLSQVVKGGENSVLDILVSWRCLISLNQCLPVGTDSHFAVKVVPMAVMLWDNQHA